MNVYKTDLKLKCIEHICCFVIYTATYFIDYTKDSYFAVCKCGIFISICIYETWMNADMTCIFTEATALFHRDGN